VSGVDTTVCGWCFDATTVNDIVAQTSISRRTFFRYFASKEDIIFSWVDEEAHTAWPLLLDPTDQECPMAMLREAFLRLASRHTGELDNLRRMMSLIFTTSSLRGRFYNVTASWQTRLYENWQESFGGDREGFFRLRVQTAAAIAAYMTAVQTWVAEGADMPLTSLVSQAFEPLVGEGAVGTGKAALSRKAPLSGKSRLQIVTE